MAVMEVVEMAEAMEAAGLVEVVTVVEMAEAMEAVAMVVVGLAVVRAVAEMVVAVTVAGRRWWRRRRWRWGCTTHLVSTAAYRMLLSPQVAPVIFHVPAVGSNTALSCE
jgi:hypothetical protein